MSISTLTHSASRHHFAKCCGAHVACAGVAGRGCGAALRGTGLSFARIQVSVESLCRRDVQRKIDGTVSRIDTLRGETFDVDCVGGGQLYIRRKLLPACVS